MKSRILSAIGETDLERPAQLNAARAANDRLKYLFSLLQMAIAHADHPDQPAASLRQERIAAGIIDSWLDDVVSTSSRVNGCCHVPGCAKLLEQVRQDLRAMALPVTADATQAEHRKAVKERLEALLSALPDCRQDQIAGAAVSAITRAGTAKGDSIHQLVLDLHKELNAMQARLAEERLDGAAVYAIEDADRPLIAAFMKGLNRTAPLKFNHPGLATTATRSGNTLILQNDIGTTDAHIIVMRVEGMAVRITYSDIHIERLHFLRDLLQKFGVSWEQDRGGKLPDAEAGEAFHLATGYFQAKDEPELRAYLEFLGSRLVFLIDWNRARKQLRPFLKSEQRDSLLKWSAEAEIGQRGFLEAGGARLINQAIDAIGGSAMHFGDRLCDVLGDEAAEHFIRFVFRAATEGIRGHQSLSLIQSRVQAELQTHFANEGIRLLQLATDHAGMIFEIATLVRDGVRAISRGLADPPGVPLGRAAVASMGVASGAIALDTAGAKRVAVTGSPVILVQSDTITSDIEGMAAAAGILTAAGGRTSHAAVVARQLDKVCLVGCRSLAIDLNRRTCRIGGRTLREGDFLSLDANDGAVYAGQLATITERPERELAALRAWSEVALPATA